MVRPSGRGFRAPITHHVIIRIEYAGYASRRALHRADTETRDVPRHRADSVTHGLSSDWAGLIRARA